MTRPDPLPFPPYAYVPGETGRHDEAVFVAFHQSVQDGMDAAALQQSLAWQAAWPFFEEGYFWEAHEVLEPVWMALPRGSPERAFVQGVIQLANAALKQKMGKPRAVLRLCDMVEAHLAQAGALDSIMGLPVVQVRDRVQALRDQANLG